MSVTLCNDCVYLSKDGIEDGRDEEELKGHPNTGFCLRRAPSPVVGDDDTFSVDRVWWPIVNHWEGCGCGDGEPRKNVT